MGIFSQTEVEALISCRKEVSEAPKRKLSLRRDVFLFGVKDNAKARLAALACREFQINRILFRSVIVHEDFENGLSKKDQSRITNAADKQFTSLSDFQANAEGYFQREMETVQ
jgi:hypothetical protein